jgi:hypothetical protein
MQDLVIQGEATEADGVIELERAPGSGWRVADVPWLRAATTEPSRAGVPTPPPPPPPDMASEPAATAATDGEL